MTYFRSWLRDEFYSNVRRRKRTFSTHLTPVSPLHRHVTLRDITRGMLGQWLTCLPSTSNGDILATPPREKRKKEGQYSSINQLKKKKNPLSQGQESVYWGLKDAHVLPLLALYGRWEITEGDGVHDVMGWREALGNHSALWKKRLRRGADFSFVTKINP